MEIDFRPALLSVIVEPPPNPLPEGVKRPGMGPRKKKNYMDQMRQWAALCGAELSPDARSPRPSSRLLMQAALVAKGHTIKKGPQTSGLQVIAIEGERLLGGADPRRDGVAKGEK